MRSLIVLLVACGASKPPVQTMTIVDAGEAPRRVVRYAYTSGAVGHVERTAQITLTTAVTNTVLETDAKRVENPLMRWVERVSIGDVAGGAAKVTSTVIVVGDEVPKAELGPFEIQVGQLKGTTSTWTQSTSGAISNPTTTATSTLELPRAIGVVFPDGEIGVGARWRVTSRERENRVMWDQTITFRLRDLTATTASLDVDIVRTARSQALSVEPTATTNVTSGSARSTATVNVSLNGLGMTGTSHTTSELSLAIVQKALRITMSAQSTGAYTVKQVTR